MGNHLYHVSEEVWTPSPGNGSGAAGGLGPPPEECDPGRQGCRTPRSGDAMWSEGQAPTDHESIALVLYEEVTSRLL